jgi:hypothetical protein
MKGDSVEVLVDAGSGAVQRFEIRATRAGRRIEVSTSRGVVEVTEVTRGGTPVRSGRFMASRVVAVVEHPATEGTGVEEMTRRRMGRLDEPVGDGTGRARRGPVREGRSAAEPLPVQDDAPEHA